MKPRHFWSFFTLLLIAIVVLVTCVYIESVSYSGVVVSKEINARVCHESTLPSNGYCVEEETSDRYWFVVCEYGVYSWVEVDEDFYNKTDIGEYVTIFSGHPIS